MIPRNLLPQIPEEKIDDFRRFLGGYGISSKLVYLPSKSLKPIQSHVNANKVKKLTQTPEVLSIPLLASREGAILDGHHRWLASMELNPRGRSLCIVCNCPIKKLIEMGHQFDGSFTKTVNEQF